MLSIIHVWSGMWKTDLQGFTGLADIRSCMDTVVKCGFQVNFYIRLQALKIALNKLIFDAL